MRRIRRPQAALIALVVALTVGYGVRALNAGSDGGPQSATSASSRTSAQDAPSPSSGEDALSQLPLQVRDTYALIRSGGPFPFPQHDGAVFRNAEHLLPREASGYYREYTVPTPGSPDRGARRLIIGRAGELYYTADHYATFRQVDVSR